MPVILIRTRAVVTMSKVVKMKAIHNFGFDIYEYADAVVTMSKVVKMKAIHNRESAACSDITLL